MSQAIKLLAFLMAFALILAGGGYVIHMGGMHDRDVTGHTTQIGKSSLND